MTRSTPKGYQIDFAAFRACNTAADACDQMLLRASISMQSPVVEAKNPIEAVLKDVEFVVIVVVLLEEALFFR